MLFLIDPTGPEDLNEQVAGCVRRGLVDGSLKAGDRLPAARELAASLGINMHTVLRAYATLRDEGVVELRRGRGAVIAADATVSHLDELVAQLITTARNYGISRQELAKRINEGDDHE